MTKLVTFFAVFTISVVATAAPDYTALARKLYPDNKEEQVFTSKFFGIVEAHKTRDPLLEGKGPSIHEYSLDKIQFSFVTNVAHTSVDLVFFNWRLAVFQGLELDATLSGLYGSNVYVLKNVSRKSISSQGKDRAQLANFSYLLGSKTWEVQIKKNAPPNYEIPEQYLNWVPHANYMEASAPLRQALGIDTLTILSPSKSVFIEAFGLPEASRAVIEASFGQNGGFENSIMGMMVHEMFHVKEGQDQLKDLAEKRVISEDRKEIVKQLEADAHLRSLVATYVKLVFSIGDSLKNKNVVASEVEQLQDLSTIVNELKNNHAEVWKFIWDFEYTEGFAEYVSAYSLVQGGIVTLAEKIDLEKTDSANNFAYRTGAIGGLYLANRVQEMPFQNQEDHRESLWQIILRKSKVQPSKTSLDALTAKYSRVTLDGEDEIKKVIKYLVSTVMEIK